MYRILIVTILVILASSVLAAEKRSPSQKSAATAALYSIGGTLVPTGIGLVLAANSDAEDPIHKSGIAFMAMGTIVGPTLGHAYARNWTRCVTGTAVRTLAWGITAAVIIDAERKTGFMEGVNQAVAAGILGGAVILASAVIDLATVGRSTKAYNRKHGLAVVSIAPAYSLVDNTTGLQISISF